MGETICYCAIMRIDLACAECGKNKFGLDEAEHDECLIFCQECGHEIGTLGQLKETVALAVLDDRPAEPGAASA